MLNKHAGENRLSIGAQLSCRSSCSNVSPSYLLAFIRLGELLDLKSEENRCRYNWIWELQLLDWVHEKMICNNARSNKSSWLNGRGIVWLGTLLEYFGWYLMIKYICTTCFQCLFWEPHTSYWQFRFTTLSYFPPKTWPLHKLRAFGTEVESIVWAINECSHERTWSRLRYSHTKAGVKSNWKFSSQVA